MYNDHLLQILLEEGIYLSIKGANIAARNCHIDVLKLSEKYNIGLKSAILNNSIHFQRKIIPDNEIKNLV